MAIIILFLIECSLTGKLQTKICPHITKLESLIHSFLAAQVAALAEGFQNIDVLLPRVLHTLGQGD